MEENSNLERSSSWILYSFGKRVDKTKSMCFSAICIQIYSFSQKIIDLIFKSLNLFFLRILSHFTVLRNMCASVPYTYFHRVGKRQQLAFITFPFPRVLSPPFFSSTYLSRWILEVKLRSKCFDFFCNILNITVSIL